MNILQLLGVEGVQTCVCFACPAEMLGEVVGVACVAKADAESPPTLESLREGLPHVNARFKPRVRSQASNRLLAASRSRRPRLTCAGCGTFDRCSC